MIPGFVSGIFSAVFSKWLIILTVGVVLVLVISIYRAGQNHATLKIQSTLNREVKKGQEKVEKEITKQKKEDTRILQAVEEIWTSPLENSPPTKEEEFKKHRDSLNHLKDLGNYGK